MTSNDARDLPLEPIEPLPDEVLPVVEPEPVAVMPTGDVDEAAEWAALLAAIAEAKDADTEVDFLPPEALNEGNRT